MNKTGGRSAVRVIRLLEPEASGRPPESSVDTDPGTAAPWPEPVGSLRDSAAGELDTQPCAPEWPRPSGALLRRGEVTEWPITFRAEPRVYASLWWRQALWSVLTLGLYLPWARRQTRHHFLQHTFVAGRRFDHEQPVIADVVRHGLLLSWLLGALAAVQGAPLAGALAVSLVLLIWPLWLGVGHGQTISALRWGRRPLTFRVPWWRVYRRMWPWVLVGLVQNWLTWWVLGPGQATPGATMLWGASGFALVLSMPAALWAWWSCRQWHLGIGPLRLSWRGSVKDVYRLAARVTSWGLGLAAIAASVHVAVLAMWAAWHGDVPAVLAGLSGSLLGLIWFALWWPYAQAHAQNLIWQQTGCRYLRFRSRLNVMAYVGMRARHAIWLLLTLGLAWPWVAVQARRMRLEAVTVVARVDPADLRAAWREPALPRQAGD